MEQELIQKGKAIQLKVAQIKSLGVNPWQPVPEVTTVDESVVREVINEDVKENQIKIQFTASDQWKAVDASYIKYHLQYGDGKSEVFENHFNKTDTKKVFFHNMPSTEYLGQLKNR